MKKNEKLRKIIKLNSQSSSTDLTGKLSLNKDIISYLNNPVSTEIFTASYLFRCVSAEDSDALRCLGCSECTTKPPGTPQCDPGAAGGCGERQTVNVVD